ncbi:MAG: hypothetical protein KDA88_06495 [Planctomycetaceae bacterium]|nr:hypothetical protein [Planctomycetaceae bacterium]
MTQSRPGSLGLLAEFLFWWLAALGVYFGSPSELHTHIPQGTEGVATVPLFNLWTIEWNVDRLEHGLNEYWHAPIFAPQRGAFAFSEPQPHTMLLAPLVWATNGVVAYNILFLTYLALNGWCMLQLMRELEIPWQWAWVAAGMSFLQPFVIWQSGVMQLTTLFAPICVIWCVVRLQKSPGWQRGCVLGVAFSFCYYVCNYYALFLSILAPAFLVLAGWRLFHWSFWKAVFIAAAVSVLLVGPVVWGQWKNLKLVKSERGLDLVRQLSAHASDYCHSRSPRIQTLDISRWGDQNRSGWYLGAGSVLMATSLAGMVGGLWRSSRRKWTLFWLAFGLLAFAASCGPLLRWRTLAPYQWLMTWYPGLDAIRSPFRFAVFVQLALVGLTAEGLWAMQCLAESLFLPTSPRENEDFVEVKNESPRWQTRLGTGLSVGFPLLFAAAAFVQIWPAGLVLTKVPQRNPNAEWIQWLQQNTAPDEVLICLPFANGTSVERYLDSTIWMRDGLDHKRPIANGYSGFFPEHFMDLRAQLDMSQQAGESDDGYRERLQNFPSEKACSWMRDRNVHLLVVRTAAMPPQVLQALSRFQELSRDEQSGIIIYSIDLEK